jgi:hypothetical protein
VKFPRAIFRVGTITFVLLASAWPPAQPQTPSPRDVVSAKTYLSSDPAARGATIQLAVVLKIRDGYHINAREKSEEYLIAPDLGAQTPPGFKIGDVAYPKGQLQKFTFSKKPLNVYQGTVTFSMPITVTSSAPVGPQQIPLKLRYQACSTDICLPPTTQELQTVVNVAASPENARSAHPEIFSAQ